VQSIVRRFAIFAPLSVVIAVTHIYLRSYYSYLTRTLDILAFVCFGCTIYFGFLRPHVSEVASKRLAPAIEQFLESPNGKEDRATSKIAEGIAYSVVIIVGLIAYLLAIDYLGHTNLEPGTFGDFFGGLLNPLLTFLTFVALVVTMAMQRVQLRKALQDSASAAFQTSLQGFETTFFNLLELHNAIVRDLHFVPDDVTLRHERPDYDENYEIAAQRFPGLTPVSSTTQIVTGRRVFAAVLDLIDTKVKRLNPFGIPVLERDVYKLVQDEHNYVLGHYFRNLFQILSLVEYYTARLSRSGDTKIFSPKRYTNLLRAQLSSHELTVLFYNCLEGMVDSGKFKRLVVEYEMLEHMPFHYSKMFHKVSVPGFDLDIERDIRHYFHKNDNGTTKKFSAGAFGRNPQIQKFLNNEQVVT
jgi:uncharacterized membrane protein